MNDEKPVEILLIEDNHTDAELTIRALKQNEINNNLVWVKDGEEALGLIFGSEKKSFNNIKKTTKVILLDLRLPKLDGLEVLKRIKADEETKKIPVIMLTSSKEERDIIESYKLGVNSFICKPVEYDEFVKTVSDMGLYWLLLNKTPA